MAKRGCRGCLAALWFVLFLIYILSYISQPQWSPNLSLTHFRIAIGNIVYWSSLGLLTLLVIKPSPQQPDANPESAFSRYWLLSFLPILLSVAGMIIYVNPHGRYPWKKYPFTTTAAHLQKTLLYERHNKSAQIILLGSSRVYTIPASYISASLGNIPAFNFGVGGAGPLDELVVTRYILHRSPVPPSVILVEVVATDLGTNYWQYSIPINLLPYLPPDKVSPGLKSIWRDTLQASSVYDAIFLQLFSNSKEYISFLDDGTGIRGRREASRYEQMIKEQLPNVYSNNICWSLDQDGQKAFEEIARLSEKHHFAVVFYRSPLNIEFFRQADLERPAYKKCQRLFQEFMDGLSARYPGVFYVDLMYYEPISTLGSQVYIDVQHLTPEGSMMVIDALHPVLEKALEWVRHNYPPLPKP